VARYHKTSVTLVEPTKESVDTFQAFFREHLDGAGRIIFEGDHRFSFYTAFEGHDIEGLAIKFSREHEATVEFLADGNMDYWLTKQGQISNGQSSVSLLH
jgi:hypothetical protein